MFKKRFSPLDEISYRIRDLSLNASMMQHGWRIWPPDATEEQKKQAIERCSEGGGYKWYAPGQIEEPVITEGKLVVPDDNEPVPNWWKTLSRWFYTLGALAFPGAYDPQLRRFIPYPEEGEKRIGPYLRTEQEEIALGNRGKDE